MILYCHTITPRLQYITDFVGNEIFGEKINLTNEKEIFAKESNLKINYSHEKISENEFYLRPHPLLFEKGIHPQQTECFEVNCQKAFFKTVGDFPFDIFAASFYLLSRYEEYLPHSKDLYGRYAHENSLAFRENFLNIPLINIWLKDFKKILEQQFPNSQFLNPQFQFLPTYDIDEAYSYKYKSWWRTAGGFARSIWTGNISELGERKKVRSGNEKDPFDSYDWMDALHEKHTLKPGYFFLLATKNGKYDKNILPSSLQMQSLIHHHVKKYEIGIHPSWQSGDDPEKIKLEILKLGHISGKQILLSRQHYIRFTLPATFRQLIEAGIKSDYSMGYGSINGFRASVSSAFYWYDLEKEQQTNLLIHPFCFMEANSFFEQKFSAHQALEEMRQYRDIIKSVNGTMITIWHNTFLGTGKLFAGWREVYARFIGEK